MKLIDSHCHLDFDPLSNELENVIERANESGVEKMINIGASLRGSKKSVEIANLYPNIWATVGLHPHDAGAIMDFEETIDKIRELSKNDQVVAIGEIGLDYFDPDGKVLARQRKEQQKLFEAQLTIAAEEDLPIVIHTRDADEDMLRILKKYLPRVKKGGVVHCFTGNKDFVKKLLDLGLYIGFTGFITFDQPKFDHIKEAVKIVPIEKLLIETDAPFLAPEPYRGKTNEPAYVKYVANKIAKIKKLSVEEVAKITSQNTEKLFNI